MVQSERPQETAVASLTTADGQDEDPIASAASAQQIVTAAGEPAPDSSTAAPGAEQPSPAARRQQLVPSAKPDLPPELRQRLQQFAEGVATDFGQWLTAAPRRRDQLAALLRALFPVMPVWLGRRHFMNRRWSVYAVSDGKLWRAGRSQSGTGPRGGTCP